MAKVGERLTSLSILNPDDETGKALLAEAFEGVYENYQKAAVSVQIKNTELSGDPDAGSFEVKRFANASSQKYGTARGAHKGKNVNAKPVIVYIDQDREFVEEIENKDIQFLGVDGLIARRSTNHAQRLIAELDSAFFAEAHAEGTLFTATGSTMADKVEEAIVTLTELKNDYIDGLDRSMLSVTLSPSAYSQIRTYLDTNTHNANVNTSAEEFITYHGVKVYESTRLPAGIDFICMMDGAIAQPIKMVPYRSEKIGLSDAYAVEMFFYYGTKAITPETILYCGASANLTVTSVAGGATGSTKITLNPAAQSGDSYKYKVGAEVEYVPIGQEPDDSWKTWDGSSDITAPSGNEIVILKLAKNGTVAQFGKAEVTAKTS